MSWAYREWPLSIDLFSVTCKGINIWIVIRMESAFISIFHLLKFHNLVDINSFDIARLLWRQRSHLITLPRQVIWQHDQFLIILIFSPHVIIVLHLMLKRQLHHSQLRLVLLNGFSDLTSLSLGTLSLMIQVVVVHAEDGL